MSEEKEAPKEGKKKGKLPVFIAIAAILFTGGFFGLKMRGGDKKKEEIKLGEIVEMPEEFLVNINGRRNYLRFKMALRLKEGFKKETVEKLLPYLSSKLTDVCEKRDLTDLAGEGGKEKLKLEIAYELNQILLAEEPHPEAKEKKADGEEGEGEGHEEGAEEKPKPKKESTGIPKVKHKGWQSDKGPILQVFFPSFATQ